MANSELITTVELAGILTQPDLRLYDCTTYLEPAPAAAAFPISSCRDGRRFEAGHIPGADFLDLQGEFSDKTTGLRFMMPAVAQLEAAFGRHGIGNDSRVVLYSIGTAMWATRFWWMLRSLGFDNVAVLDGGIDKWTAEGRAHRDRAGEGISAGDLPGKAAGRLFRRQGRGARGEQAIASTVVVNALGPQFHKGLEPSRYGRPGRIPGSCNVPAATLVDPATKTFVPLADAEQKFAAQGSQTSA